MAVDLTPMLNAFSLLDVVVPVMAVASVLASIYAFIFAIERVLEMLHGRSHAGAVEAGMRQRQASAERARLIKKAYRW